MSTLLQDLRYSYRTLGKNPGFTIVALLTLALGIGANTAIFSVVNTVLIRNLPFSDPDRLVTIYEDASKAGFPRNTPSPANYQDWKNLRRIFSDVAATADTTANLTGHGEPEKLEGRRTTYNLFSVLGVEPALGRSFTPAEDQPGDSRVILISDALWTRRFASDPKLIGRTIELDGKASTVIGIMPRGFSFPDKDTVFWVPAAFTVKQLAERDSHYLRVVGRLAPGVTLDQANAELAVLRAQLAARYPDELSSVQRFVAEPVQLSYTIEVRRGLIVLLIAVGCILLIACANIANLTLSRATRRRRELGVRTALGAGRIRIVRQLLTESLFLSLAGGLVGLILAEWCFPFLSHLIPAALSTTVKLGLDWRVLLFALAISIGSSVFFGIAPAIQAAGLDLNEVLKEGGRSGLGSRSGALRSVLVVMEVSLSLVLMIGAMLLIRSFSNLRNLDPGFRADHVLTLRLNLSRETYGDFAKRTIFLDRVLDRMRALPGVETAGFTSALPLVWKGGTNGFDIEGKPLESRGEARDACDRVISPGYLEAMRIRLVRGRFLNDGDREHSRPVAVINETMGRRYWPHEDPLGKRFRMQQEGYPWVTIVGVAGDVRQMGLDEKVMPEMDFPYWQSKPNWMIPRDLVLRTAGDPASLIAAARKAIWSIDPNQPVSNVQTLDDLLNEEVANRRVQVTLLGALAALAVLLSCIGIYGVLAYNVTARTQEIGLRVALGAGSSEIWRAVAARGLTMAGLGIAIGLSLAFVLTRLLASLLFGVGATDPLTYFCSAAGFALVSLLACWIPARRASRVDPMVALRYE